MGYPDSERSPCSPYLVWPFCTEDRNGYDIKKVSPFRRFSCLFGYIHVDRCIGLGRTSLSPFWPVLSQSGIWVRPARGNPPAFQECFVYLGGPRIIRSHDFGDNIYIYTVECSRRSIPSSPWPGSITATIVFPPCPWMKNHVSRRLNATVPNGLPGIPRYRDK